ncbi:hypothetical protein HDU85_004278 [Gaertneriomyces sp. JEL0708]|nr:hypothetical protein HDU85_004278 [Gaertneriomyces sp. JEL0708]
MSPRSVTMKLFLGFILHALVVVQQYVEAALDENDIGGAGMSLRFSADAWYKDENLYRALMMKGNYAPLEGVAAKQQAGYESPVTLWPSLDSFTIEAWVKPGPHGGRRCCWPILETYSATDASAPAIILKIVDNGAIHFGTERGFESTDPCGSAQGERSSEEEGNTWSAFASSTWHHVAVVYDAASNQKFFYGDGELLMTVTCTSAAPFKAQGGSFNIGWSKRNSPQMAYDGEIDELRFWKEARSIAQIQDTMYRPLTSAEIVGNMVFYYHMDDYIPSEDMFLKDQSENGYDLKMASAERTAPVYVPSTAPIYGGQLGTIITRISTGSGSVELGLVDSSASGTSSWTAAVLFSSCASDVLGLELHDGTPITVPSISFAATQRLILTAPAAAIDSPPVEHCTLRYTVTDTVSAVTSSPRTVSVSIKTNRSPVIGDAGGALYCDGDDWAYAKDFSFNTTNYGEYTIEFWTYHLYSDGPDATLFSIGNNEIGAPDYASNWCKALSTETRWDTDDFCIGRFVFHQYTVSNRLEAYSSWNPLNNDGVIMKDITRYFEQWKHMAIVSNEDTLAIYLNGQLLESFPNEPFYGTRDGLYLCHWPFWGPYHWYKGFVDEFRVWNHARTPEQIRTHMHSSLQGTEEGLLGYWDFNEYADLVAFNQTHNPSDLIQDKTKHGNDLVPGGCVPNKFPYCKLGDGLCQEKESPMVDCYDIDGTTQSASARPTLYLSSAPVGGHFTPLVLEAGVKTTFSLDAQDPDRDVVSIEILTVPDRGALYTITDERINAGDTVPAGTQVRFHNPNVYEGGYPATQFTYRVSDGLESSAEGSIKFYVKCPANTYLDASSNQCRNCGRGEYLLTSGFHTECKKYSNITLGSPLGIILTTLTTVSVAYTVGMAGFVVMHRGSKIIRAASPAFCLMIILGCTLGLLDVYTYIDMPNATTCVLQPVFLAMGFTIAIGCLVIKTMRVQVVFNYPLLARRYKWAMTDTCLAVVSIAAVAVDWIILIPWFSADRPKPTLLTDQNGGLYWACPGLDEASAFGASTALIVYNALWLLLGVYSAVKVRNVKSAYNESQHIVPCIYILFLVSLILLALNYAMALFSYHVRSIFVSFLLIVSSVFVTSQLFIPKVLAIKMAGHEKDNKGGFNQTSTNVIRSSRINASSTNARTSEIGDEGNADSVGETSQKREVQTSSNVYMTVAMVDAQIGGGVFGGFSAHSLFFLGGLNAIVLRKYRQTVASYYMYKRSTVASINPMTISLATVDGVTIKLKFDSAESKDAWMITLKGGSKSPGIASPTAPSNMFPSTHGPPNADA